MTQAPDLKPKLGPGARGSRTGGAVREPPKEVRLLLPVWGEQFIVQFLRVSLPTLLAPGNLPAVAAALPCKFVFLTDTDGAEILRTHPAVAYIQKICDVEIEIIDDLITGDNYSTTITLSYARAVRAAGAAMLDTCFFFLISDYVMADGSLANVLTRMQAGFGGVLAGNFQVVEEDARSTLFGTFDSGEPEMVISARDLMKWAIKYLHPMTLANTVNFPMYHSAHSNRLFWRADENTLIGRFYLMHMICIRPEVMDFGVSSSCDYSFIPEMCPSGNVHVMTDSDEYLVVEMQKRLHENKFIRLGAKDRADLTTSLAEWTTERHRVNAHSPVVFHADEISPAVIDMIAESREFIEAIAEKLPAPQPHRDHPYWIGAIAAHRREVWRRRQKSNSLYAPEEPPRTSKALYHDLLFRGRDMFFGRQGSVKPWHPRWPDYRMIGSLASRYLTENRAGRSLVLSSTPAAFRNWLTGPDRTSESADFYKLLEFDAEQYEQMIGVFDGCLLVLAESEISHAHKIIERIRPLLSVGDHILVFLLNGRGLMVAREFNHDVLRQANGFFDAHMSIDDVQFVAAGWSTWTALRAIRRLFELVMRSPFNLVIAALPIGVLLTFSLMANYLGRRVGPRPPNNELCSSIGIAMRVAAKSTVLPQPAKVSELELAGRRFKENQFPLASAPSERIRLSRIGYPWPAH